MDLTKNILIKANPGTGKTTSLADRVIELIKNGVDENEILCLTFTNKAVDEMFDKITSKFVQNGIGVARINNLGISTFHSFCNNYFSEEGRGYELVSNNFIRFAIYKSLEKNNAFNYERDYIVQDLIPKIENSIRYIKSFNVFPSRIDLTATKGDLMNSSFLENMSGIRVDEILAFLDYFITAFEDYERDKGDKKIDYNDLLSKFLIEYDPLKKHYKYVLVDELQDLNDVEAAIARMLGDYLFLVGDRKQSIFGFQGGSLKNFMELEKLPNLEKSTKTLNYRSYNRILDYSKNYFLSKTKDKTYNEELNDFRGNLGAGGEVLQIVGSNVNNIAVKHAMDLLYNGKKVAIISRTNEQILDISRLLDAKNLKYATTTSASVSQRAKNSVIDFIKGLFYRDERDILKALFTPFSGIPLRKAFEIEEKLRKKEITFDEVKRLAKPFFDSLQKSFDIYGINKVFNEIILPISMALDKDYYISASAILENLNDYFGNADIPNLDDMLIYLSAAEDSYQSDNTEENLILTTVHKAKGLEFDNVIYIPKKQNTRTSFIDLITNSIIKQAKGVDVKEELSEESIRVDFVAFTRAKERLLVVTNPVISEDYYIEGFIDKKYEEIEDEPAPYKKRYEEAYSLFVNKEYEDSKKALEDENRWLSERIYNYFQNSLKKLSFSLIDAAQDPTSFVKSHILGIKEKTTSINFGSRVHDIAEDYFKNILKEEELGTNEIKALENIRNVIGEIKTKYGAEQIDSEKSIELPLEAIFPDLKEHMMFTGKLDAIFLNKEKNKLLIIDFKTDRSDENGSKHRRQLALYRRMLAIEKKIDEKNIDTAIAYINLTGKINTGKFDWKLDTRKVKDSQMETIQKHIMQLFEYKENPEKLIEKLIEKHYYSDSLGEEIFNRLNYEYGHSKHYDNK
jgi:DNA helicase-2/ATP-dependent DNA helicase PcrA